MATTSKTVISYEEDEQVLVELEAAFVDVSKGALLKKMNLSADTTLIVTNKRIIATTGIKDKKKGLLSCCCCCASSDRSIRFFLPKQIAEVGYRVASKKACCCGNDSFVIFIRTSGAGSAEFYLTGVKEGTVQDVLKLMYSIANS